ncbi:hypothetical protein [Pseudorhodoplanes sp.]|uniref:hypothetical protein n=1 Tax=Pseudorhodoplanes sp. TaxID=1934341 RepID=UPI003D110FF1
MSVFDDVPEPFPFEADVSKRPVSVVLRGDPADRYIVGFLGLFWLAFGSVVTVAASLLALASMGLQAYGLPATAIAVACYVAAVVWYLWPEFNAGFRTVTVDISDERVDVKERDLIRKTAWSHPLSGFEGVAQINMGTRLVGETKIPLLSVVLKHPDPARSVPLAIGEPGKIGRRTVVRKAKQLGLPAIEGIGDETGAAAYPPDTIVVNRWQALKVRLLYWGFVGATLLFAGGTLWQHLYTTIDPAWPILAVIGVGVSVAMHVYVRKYVIGMKERDGEIAVCTASLLFRWHRFPRSRVRSLDYRAGRMTTPRHSVNAPWVTMRVEGCRFAFMIDMQSDFVDMRKLSALGLARK